MTERTLYPRIDHHIIAKLGACSTWVERFRTAYPEGTDAPTSPEHWLDALERGLSGKLKWIWRATGDNRWLPDFYGLDLHDYILYHVPLDYVDLRNADLSGAYLEGGDMTYPIINANTNFDGAHLNGLRVYCPTCRADDEHRFSAQRIGSRLSYVTRLGTTDNKAWRGTKWVAEAGLDAAIADTYVCERCRTPWDTIRAFYIDNLNLFESRYFRICELFAEHDGTLSRMNAEANVLRS